MPNYLPDIATFVNDVGKYRLVPLCREIIADLDTPLTLYAKVAEGREHAFLFESMEGGEKWGRFSFIGYDPLLRFSSRGAVTTITETMQGKSHTRQISGNPLQVIKELIGGCGAASYAHLPRFCGGAVGYLGYDMVRFIEELPAVPVEEDAIADSSFLVPKIVLVHDSFRQTVTVVCWVQTNSGAPQDLYARAVADIEEVVRRIRGEVPAALGEQSGRGVPGGHHFQANMDKDQFIAMVARAKEYILAGDIIQVVLSQRFSTTTAVPPLVLYRALRHINPSPYLFFLRLGEVVQIGSSPEILVRKDGIEIELRPIAGTRRRGVDQAEDLALERELLADPKETAEHLMLVDLGRNDVGRVARGGHVRVEDLLVIERYSHVMHIVSGVRGTIAEGRDQFDVLAACFPAGTVSGAPKIRAMQIIDELEPDRRGAYAGAVGYFGFSDNMDFCITIRTFVLRGEELRLQAGAGIVADSDPEAEFEETVNKSRALRRALALAEKGF
jgi:anthranilate synthase component I